MRSCGVEFVARNAARYSSSGFGVALDSSEEELLLDFLALLDELEVPSLFVSSLELELGEA